jgi:hypothetical protein
MTKYEKKLLSFQRRLESRLTVALNLFQGL